MATFELPNPDATPPPVARIVEALLFAGGQPITAKVAASAIRDLTPEQFQGAIAELTETYHKQNRPYAIKSGAKGFTLAIKPAFRGLHEKSPPPAKVVKLAQPTQDVLAVVAYQQPVTRKTIDSLLQRDSSGQLRSLVRMNLISMSSNDAKNDAVYTTTPRFLEMFHLKTLADLPRPTELKRISHG